MWRLYCGDKEGVAIRTTYGKLESSLSDPEMYIGVVTYKDYEKDGYPLYQLNPKWPPEHSYYYPFMHKRKAFEHEREVRIIKTVQSDVATEPGIRLKWDLEKVFEEVYVNPYAGEGFRDAVKAVVTKFEPQFEDVLRWSAMKTEPFY